MSEDKFDAGTEKLFEDISKLGWMTEADKEALLNPKDNALTRAMGLKCGGIKDE